MTNELEIHLIHASQAFGGATWESPSSDSEKSSHEKQPFPKPQPGEMQRSRRPGQPVELALAVGVIEELELQVQIALAVGVIEVLELEVQKHSSGGVQKLIDEFVEMLLKGEACI